MTDDREPTTAELMQARRAALAPQFINTARALEVMQTAEVRKRQGSDQTFDPAIGQPSTAELMQFERARLLRLMGKDIDQDEERADLAVREKLAQLAPAHDETPKQDRTNDRAVRQEQGQRL